MKLFINIFLLVTFLICQKVEACTTILAHEFFGSSHLTKVLRGRFIHHHRSDVLGHRCNSSSFLERDIMTTPQNDESQYTKFYSHLDQQSFKNILDTYKDHDLDQLKYAIKETQHDVLLTNSALGEQSYGISLQVAEYWRQRGSLLKLAIIMGDEESRDIYKEYLSHFSDNIQLPQVGLNEKEQEIAFRTFYWSLLAFEDPIARSYLAQNYHIGLLVPLNKELSIFWEQYNEDVPLPFLIRTKLLEETSFYPFKKTVVLPSQPEDWKKFFPTKTYHEDLNNFPVNPLLQQAACKTEIE